MKNQRSQTVVANRSCWRYGQMLTFFLLLLLSQQSFAQKKVIGYLPTWANFPNIINTIDLTKLSHINIAFANPNGSGVINGPSASSIATVVNAAHSKNVKVFMSIGGAGAPGAAYQSLLSNTTNMNNFVNTLVQYTLSNNLDGIDVDIEGDVLNGSTVTAAQYQNFIVKLGTELRARNKQMTSALAGWFAQYVTNTAAAQFDWINIMSYDAAGSWSGPGQHSSYQLAVDDFNFWKNSKGVPANKLVVGVPFYGYGWGTYGNGTYLAYSTIVNTYGGSPNSDQVGSGNNVIYYNGIPTIKSKAIFALQQDAGGIMIWELSQDLNDSRSLLNAISQVISVNSNPVPDNLAKGKSVVATSTEASTTTSTVASNATDGSYGTRWSSAFADPQSITVDLGANYNVNRVKLTWEAAMARDYQIQVSSDNNTFNTIKPVTGNTTTTNDHTGLAATARYVRILGTARVTTYGYSLYEIEVYGSAIESPYSGTPINIPGKIEAEFYNLGGEGLAYHDNDAANQGGAFRTSEGADIETTTDVGTGYNIGYTADGEWLKYMVNVTAAGNYSFSFRTAGTGTASKIRVEVDGADVTGSVALPATAGWQTWTTTTVGNVPLTTGAHNIRLFIVTGGFNLNYVTVNTLANVAPTVSLTSPASGAIFTAPAAVTISANASDADGLVSKVEFFNGTTLLGTSTTAPYSFTWNNVAVGTYAVSAKATDNAGASASTSAVSITVKAPNVAPTVTLTSPVSGAVFTAPASVSISANATDSDGLVSKVEFYNGTTLLGTSTVAPYSFNWNNVTAGTYSLSAKATDNSNAATTSAVATIVVNVPNSTPYGGTPAAIPGTVHAENYDNGGEGIAYHDNEPANQGSSYRTSEGVDVEATADGGAGYNVGWTADGEWMKYTVNVTSAGTYNVSFRTAGTGTASAIRLEVDGIDKTGSVALPNTAGWQTWATTTVSNISFTSGVHVIRIFTVTGGFNLNSFTVVAPNVAPSVTLISPATGAAYTAPASITITAGATDSDGSISKVEFYNGTTLLGTSTTSPYSFNWTNVAVGTYAISAKATDNSGAATTTAAISIAVKAPNVAPTVSITSPISGVVFTAPATISISANAADSDGSISKVEFFNGTTLIGTSTTAPYSFAWNNVAAGTYAIAAKATDNTGATATSAVVNITVKLPGSTPYGGTPATLPGTVQAENYDNGGEGLAYHENEAANQGNQYRTTEGVDVEVTSDAGAGYNVGYTADGEWLKYTVNVTTAGTYNVSFRTAGTGTASALRLEVDGIDKTGTVALPNTTGWQIWNTTTVPNVSFTSGAHVLRIFVVTGGFNLNSFAVSTPSAMSFLRANGKNIVNNNGNYLIKAVNLGNYMVQEGYMMNLGGGYQWNIKNKIADVVGVANRDQFYQDYLANFITKADIDSIAKFGFNSVRLPMHYNLFTPLGQQDTYLESGFVLVDNIVNWCKANNMYVILDLHAAPGGQSRGDISDYIEGQPSLWESEANRAQTVKLWRKFAERYVNEPAVGGYDLINETNWTLPNNNQLLVQLMKDITASIRQVDNNHLIFIEGNSYANDYTGLTPKWDNNMAYSFHKYWNDNSQASLNFVLSVRDGQNAPIWLGEFAENSNHWIAEAVTIMNNNNIGWAVWPYKKMSSVSAIGSFKQPNNWSALANYINGGTRPSAAVGQAILNELIENVKTRNCTFNNGYLYALLKQPNNNSTMAYAPVTLPARVLAAHYDEGKNGYAFSDAAFQNTQFGSTVGSSTSWNIGWYYRNDGVDLQYSSAENGPTVGYVDANEWLNYTVNVSNAGVYSMKARVAGNGGSISVSVDGATVISNASVSATGGWDVWQTVTLGNINLSAGKHTIRVTASTAGYNLSYFDFTAASSTDLLNRSEVIETEETISLSSFPNPVTTATIVQVTVREDGDVSVKVYDKTGLELATLATGYLPVGTYDIPFDASQLKNDLYIIKCTTKDKVITRKMIKAE